MDSRPNLLLFMPDQLRADAVGAFGNPLARTPHLDALAARGVRFGEAYAQHSVCSPSRVSLMTGWYPHVAGHRTLTHLLKPWEPNLLKLLRESGYHVAWVGQRGDTFSKGVTAASTDFYGWKVRPKGGFHRSPYPPEHPLARAFYHGRRDSDGPVLDFDEAAVQTAEAWLADAPREPWLLFVALVFPHPPFAVEEPWYSLHDRAAMPPPVAADIVRKPGFVRAIRERYGTDRLEPKDWAEIAATYYGMVSRVDDQLGRVLRAIERAGAAERTTTVFFTDHGEYLGDYGLIEKWPSGLDHCLVRNPLVIAGPGVREGARCDSLVELVDLLPTLLELGGAEAKHTHFGRSLAPLLRDATLPHRDAAFSEGGFLREEEHLLERAPFPYDLKAALQHERPELAGRAVALRTRDWTYVHRLYEGPELYDRRADPREQRNQAGAPAHAETERRLRDRLLEWTLATSDVIPWQPDGRFDV
jgi:arylsulfatase A-like enzyme